MDSSFIFEPLIKTLWWFLPIAVLIGVARSPWFKGLVGEAWVKFAAWLRLPADTYHRIHNVTLPTIDGTTQIDHVFVSRYGIFVVETKNMKGWIFGSEHQAQWTQKIYRTSIKFQNPLRQNYRHVKALEAALEVPAQTIHSVVVFTGDCAFKSEMPANVTMHGGYVSYILSFREPVFPDEQVQEIVAAIEAGRLAPSRQTHRLHVQQTRERVKANAGRRCPSCGSTMVLRTASRGPNAGGQFWGCADYPRCRTVRKLE